MTFVFFRFLTKLNLNSITCWSRVCIRKSMAGRSILDDGLSVAHCKTPDKFQTCNLSVNGCVKQEKDTYRSSFDQYVSLFLKEICLGDSFRPLPPMLGNGQSVDLLKLFFVVTQKGGYDTVSKKGLWDKVGHDHGLGSGIGSAIRLIYNKYLDSLERELLKISEDKDFKGQLWCGSVNVDGVLMELEREFEFFMLKVIDQRKKTDAYHHLEVEKSELSCTDGCEAKCQRQNLKVEKSEAGSTNDVSSDMSENQKVDAYVIDNVKSKVNSNVYAKCLMEDEEEMMVLDSIEVKQAVFHHKRKKDCVSRMLRWMASIAKDPTDPSIGTLPGYPWEPYSSNVYWKQVLLAREVLLLKRPKFSSAEQSMYLCQQKQRMHPSMFDDQIGSVERLRSSLRLHSATKAQGSSQSSFLGTPSDRNAGPSLFLKRMENQPDQQSLGRTDSVSVLNSPYDAPIRKRIPVGQYFQAEVLEWTGVAAESDSKWLGTIVWPLEKREPNFLIERDPIGKCRTDSCGCHLPGSVECVRFHVAEKRMKIKLELGSAFNSWKFDMMGEEVGLSWTEEEEKKFNAVVQANPQSQNKCFWGQMFKFLPSKSREDQVSYYFNVFLLQRRGYQNRYTSSNIDSDDDETEFALATNKYDCGKTKLTRSILSSQRKKARVNL